MFCKLDSNENSRLFQRYPTLPQISLIANSWTPIVNIRTTGHVCKYHFDPRKPPLREKSPKCRSSVCSGWVLVPCFLMIFKIWVQESTNKLRHSVNYSREGVRSIWAFWASAIRFEIYFFACVFFKPTKYSDAVGFRHTLWGWRNWRFWNPTINCRTSDILTRSQSGLLSNNV